MYNIFSWPQLSNMLYVDQPAGTGFSVGDFKGTTEEEIARQFLGFYHNWMETFNTTGGKTYITGESYAGIYIPYIGDAMIQSKQAADYNLSGALLFSPTLHEKPVNYQQEVVTKPFLDEYNNVMGLYPDVGDYYSRVAAIDKACGFAELREKYFTFPPSGRFPPANNSDECYVSPIVLDGLGLLNPCYSLYHISQSCPQPSDALDWAVDGDNSSVPVGFAGADWRSYLNLPQMREAIHIPAAQKVWKFCSDADPFGPYGDQSEGPFTSGALKRVIEHTNNFVIGSGSLDLRVPTNGTLMVLQNLTWNGRQGFDEFPSKPLVLPATFSDLSTQSSSGKVGDWVEQRGVTFARVYNAGHGEPPPNARPPLPSMMCGRCIDD